MNAEQQIYSYCLDLEEKNDTCELDEVIDSEEFDLSAFFGFQDEIMNDLDVAESVLPDEKQLPLPDLLVTLRDDSNESITTLTTKITAESFATGASLTSGVFSALGSLVGSCGVFCAHSLGTLASAGSGLSGGLSVPGFSLDNQGNFHLDGSVDALSHATGISQEDLRADKFSAEDILTRFFSIFGEGMSLIFGFGCVGKLIDCFFESFISNERFE